jgi:hypothetical protein
MWGEGRWGEGRWGEGRWGEGRWGEGRWGVLLSSGWSFIAVVLTALGYVA